LKGIKGIQEKGSKNFGQIDTKYWTGEQKLELSLDFVS
jgi:hypothetical protein